MNKLIREGRFGPPKCWKTGAVVSTYPRPLLCLQLDQNGMDIIDKPVPVEIPLNEFEAWSKKERLALPEISFVDFCKVWKPTMTEDLSVPMNKDGWAAFNKAIITLTRSCPWRTLVIDSTTSLQKMLLGYISATATAQLADARKWAATVGGKIEQVIAVCSNLSDTHFVIIMHEDTDKNELLSTIETTPMIYSKFRLYTGGVLSQLFYQKIENGQPAIYTQSTGYVKGIGARWPDLTKRPIIKPPTFEEIYGKALK